MTAPGVECSAETALPPSHHTKTAPALCSAHGNGCVVTRRALRTWAVAAREAEVQLIVKPVQGPLLTLRLPRSLLVSTLGSVVQRRSGERAIPLNALSLRCRGRTMRWKETLAAARVRDGDEVRVVLAGGLQGGGLFGPSKTKQLHELLSSTRRWVDGDEEKVLRLIAKGADIERLLPPACLCPLPCFPLPPPLHWPLSPCCARLTSRAASQSSGGRTTLMRMFYHLPAQPQSNRIDLSVMTNIVKALLAAGADVNAKDDVRHSPASVPCRLSSPICDCRSALWCVHLACCVALQTGLTALFYAVINLPAFGDLEKSSKTVELLIAAGADVNAKDDVRHPPASVPCQLSSHIYDCRSTLWCVHLACCVALQKGSTALLRSYFYEALLMAAGADIHAKDHVRHPPASVPCPILLPSASCHCGSALSAPV